MKKLISVLLVLAMLVMTTAVFTEEAVSSKTAEDIATAEVLEIEGNENANLTVEIVEAGEAVAALQTKAADAIAAGDLSSVLPEDVLGAIPADFLGAASLADNLKEMVALKVSGDAEGVTAITFALTLETPYEDGEEVYVAFALMDGETVAEWIVKPGTVKEGAVQVELTAEEMTKMVGNTFAAIVFSK